MRLGLAATLGLLLAHALGYRFLTDDAFISFRYARNLADGFGLVFNPGGPRVEGFSNPLWTFLLAGGRLLGVEPERAAFALSLAATVGTWFAFVGLCRLLLPRGRSPAWLLVPTGLLALTRSVAVWSTGGLETRLYECLLLAGALCVLREAGRGDRHSDAQATDADGGGRSPRYFGALLLGLAALTRPDGLLTGGAVLAAATLPALLRGRRAWALRSLGLFAGLIAAQYLARYAYFGAWLPNTWYAKVDGQSWWALGWRYLAAFGLEYALWSWLPLLALGAWSALRSGHGRALFVALAAVVPHALYLAAIGGDHFEWRPLGPVFLFGLPFLGAGAALLGGDAPRAPGSPATSPPGTGRARRLVTATWLLAVTAGTLELPLRSHLEFPTDRYRPGFPKASMADAEGREFLLPENGVLSRLPGFARLASLHRELLLELSNHFAALRQEEHAAFQRLVEAEAARLVQLRDRGVLPADLRLALDCVGVIPYRTDFLVLDRLGLTDATVAQSGFESPNLMAHGKRATLEYVVEQKTDLYAKHPVVLSWVPGDEDLLRHLAVAELYGEESWFALTAEGWVLWAWLPRGADAARERFPELRWRSTLDREAVEELRADWRTPVSRE